MNWTIEFAPLLPSFLLWLMVLATLGLGVFLLWQRFHGAPLRLASLGLLLLALFNPTLKQEERSPLSSIVLVVTDQSDSHKMTGRSKLTTDIRTRLAAKLKKVPNVETRWVTSTHNSASRNHSTQLTQDISRGLADIPTERLAGVIVISDGRIHDIPANPDALGLNVPLHLMLPGLKGEFDRRIELKEVPRFGLVGSSRPVKLRISQSGTSKTTGKIARLIIKRQDKPDEMIRIPVGEIFKIDFPFPHSGQNLMELELVPVEGELTKANNRLALTAEGVRENLRVLLVSGEPHPGERAWRNLLKSDASVDLVHFTILRPPQKRDNTPINQLSLIAFPTRELFSEKLSGFDLIIFDRYKRRGVLPRIYLGNVANYVKKGGAVLMATGSAFSSNFFSLYNTPLNTVLPAAPTGNTFDTPYTPLVTKDGLRHPVTGGLSGGNAKKPKWGRWHSLIDSSQKSGKVLMKGSKDRPLLILDRVGKGRVAMLMSDQAWLWSRGYEGGGPYSTLLRRVSHWLMKEPDLEEEYLRGVAEGKKLIIKRHSMADTVAPIEMTLPTGEKQTVILKNVAPGLWQKTITTDMTGLYHLQSGSLKTMVHIGRINSREMSAVTATAKPLSPILKNLGGGSYWLGKKSEDNTTGADKHLQDIATALPRISMLQSGTKFFGQSWLGLKKRNAYEIRGVSTLPLFSGLLALALALGLLSLMWFQEGRGKG